MDDLELLAGLRADVPPPDRFAELRVRNQLLAAAAASPGDGVPATDAPVVPVLAGGGGGRRGSPRRWLSPARVGIAVAAAAAVLAGGVVLTDDGGGLPIGATPAAAEVLNRVADSASRAEPLPTPGPGQVLYRRSLNQQALGTMGNPDIPSDPARLCADVHELWIPVDPDADRTMIRGGPVLPRPGNADPATMPRDPACGPWSSFGENLGPSEGPEGPEDAATLPTDPRQVYERYRGIGAGQGSNDAEGTLFRLEDAASSASPFLSPAQVAAIYRAMTYVPGMELLGPGTDLLGRPGIVVGRYEAARGTRTELVFDEDSGRLLGRREVVVEPDVAFGPLPSAGPAPTGSTDQDGGSDVQPPGPVLPAGTVIWQAVITTAVVDAVNERPTD